MARVRSLFSSLHLIIIFIFPSPIPCSRKRASFSLAPSASCVLRWVRGTCTLCFVRHVMQHSMRVRWFSRPIFARCVGAPGVGALPTHAVAGGFHAFFFPSGVFYLLRGVLGWPGHPRGGRRICSVALARSIFLLFWRAFLVYLDAELTPGYHIHGHMQTKKRRACCW